MSAQHTPGPKVHLQPTTRTGLSVCRYGSHRSRTIKSLPIQEFAETPAEQRCSECEAKYQRFYAAIAKAIGSAEGKCCCGATVGVCNCRVQASTSIETSRCTSKKCGEFNMLRCAGAAGHDGDHCYVVDHTGSKS